jgi:hypothetical protein
LGARSRAGAVVAHDRGGGQLLGELLPPAGETSIATLVRDQLAGALNSDAAGRPVFALTLPDREVLDGIAIL